MLLTGIIIVAFSIVWCEVLTAPGMIFSWVDKYLHKYIKSDYLLKPLGDCVYCFGGQLALWTYLIMYFKRYNFIEHFSFIVLILFVIHIYKNIWS